MEDLNYINEKNKHKKEPSTGSFLPSLFLDSKLIKENDNAIIKQIADYYISNCGYKEEYVEIQKLRAAVEGVINEGDYKHTLSPFGLKNNSKLKSTTTLKNYNILKAVTSLFEGEFGRRTHEYSVIDGNPVDDSRYKESLYKLYEQHYAQEVVNKLNEQGFSTGEETVEQPPLEQKQKELKNAFDKERVINGQDALDYIKSEQKVEEKIIEMYHDWITVGRGISYKTVRFDDVDYEYVPAEEYFFPHETHSPYIEDYSYGVRRKKTNISRLLDLFHNIFGDDIEMLEDLEANGRYSVGNHYNNTASTTNTAFGRNGYINNTNSRYIDSLGECKSVYGEVFTNTDDIDYFHVVFKGFLKVGELTYIDELGQERVVEVDDTYKLNKDAGDIKIKWHYENRVFEIHKAGDYFFGFRPIPYNRAEVNNKSVQKLPYNGRVTRTRIGQINSIIKEGYIYQLLVNTVSYLIEKTLLKNKNKLLVLPKGLVTSKKGLNTTDTMVHADETSILWIDESAPNAAVALQAIKSIDMQLFNDIAGLQSLRTDIINQFWSSIGMNAQRFNDIDTRAGKSTTEQAILRSAIITAESVRQFDKFIQTEYEGFLDLSKMAWVDGIKKKYIKSDGAEAMIELNADDYIKHLESDYNVFVKDSQELTENMNTLKQLVLPMLQNNGGLKSVGTVLSLNSPEKIAKILADLEDKNQDLEQQNAESQRQHEQEMAKIEEEGKEKDRDVDRYKADSNKEAIIQAAKTRAESTYINKDIPNALDKEKFEHQKDIENKELEHQIQVENKELVLEDKKINVMKLKNNKK